MPVTHLTPPATILVTGTSRGIGLELVRQLLASGHHVIATCRRPDTATQLAALGPSEQLEILALDVVDAASVATLAGALGDRPLDALVNNAGVMHRQQALSELDYRAWLDSFAANTLGPMRVAIALKANLMQSSAPRVLTVSSQMGSIERAGTGSIAYRSSKAAVNMAMRSLAQEWQPDGITVTVCHPGWVRTDMGGIDAALDVRTSAADLARLLISLQPEHSGAFLNHDGTDMPW